MTPPGTETAPPPGALPPRPSAGESSPDQPSGLFQFNFTSPNFPGTISVTVASTPANARGLAYLVAEEFCQRVIGEIKQG